jgi:hypothetical protein
MYSCLLSIGTVLGHREIQLYVHFCIKRKARCFFSKGNFVITVYRIALVFPKSNFVIA